VINHVAKNKIEVSFYRIKNEGDELVYTKLFTDSKTKNIWVYGLDDDEFEVKGNKKSNINIRLLADKTMISIQMVVKLKSLILNQR
jgi:hypothetical protein